MRIQLDAIHRTHYFALRLIEMADAFGAELGIDDVEIFAHGNGVVRARWLANVAINAFIGDSKSHDRAGVESENTPIVVPRRAPYDQASARAANTCAA
jgi:hypothetical protein